MLENDSSALVHETDWRYAENPDISELVYLSATVYMVIIGSFGILSNGSIILAFFRGTAEVGHLSFFLIHKKLKFEAKLFFLNNIPKIDESLTKLLPFKLYQQIIYY